MRKVIAMGNCQTWILGVTGAPYVACRWTRRRFGNFGASRRSFYQMIQWTCYCSRETEGKSATTGCNDSHTRDRRLREEKRADICCWAAAAHHGEVIAGISGVDKPSRVERR